MPLKKTNDDWLKRQQRLHVSDVAEEFVSVTMLSITFTVQG
jgi:hypothetical protein